MNHHPKRRSAAFRGLRAAAALPLALALFAFGCGGGGGGGATPAGDTVGGPDQVADLSRDLPTDTAPEAGLDAAPELRHDALTDALPDAMPDTRVDGVGDTAADGGPDTPVCPAGTNGCPCELGDLCGSGLVCDNGTCVPSGAQTFAISDPAARACELVLRETTGKVLDVTFAPGVAGAMQRREPAVAVVFYRTVDEAFLPGAVALSVTGDAAGFSLRSATCYDRLGQALEDVEVTFGE